MDILAIIPARGGSKRIPKKNIRPFLGKPIISYVIEAAIDCGLFDEIMVSTDSIEIAEIAKRYGASVPFMRSATMADDFSTTGDVLLEVLEEYKKRGRTFQYMVCLYPTAPFINSKDLRRATDLLMENENATMAMPLTAFSYPPQRCYVIDRTRMAVFQNPEYFSTRSQDLQTLYHDAGQYYVYNVKKFIEAKGKIYDNILPIIIDEMQVQDIDNESDWEIAELKYQLMKKKS